MEDVVLEIRAISKAFPGVQALDRVTIELRRHEILGLVGENGAGKSTLLKILAGLQPPDSGEILLDGQPIRPRSVKDARRLGIAMVFQEQSLLANLSIRENMFLGDEEEFSQIGLLNWKRLSEETRRQMSKVGVSLSPELLVADLTFAQRQMVEIAKAMALEERISREPILVLDEPTSVLQREEIELLFDRLRSLVQRASIVFVSHRLDEVLRVTDRICVLKDGCNVATFKTSETSAQELHRLMVGRERKAEYYREGEQIGYGTEVVLRAIGLGSRGAFRDVNLELHKGEILGVCGVLGSGREALCRCLFGARRVDAGRIEIDGRSVAFRSAIDAIRHGIGYVPMERRTEGLILYLGVAPNVTLASLENVIRHGTLNYRLEEEVTAGWIKYLHIRTPSTRTLCLRLSGGNQQKVVLAKWLASQARVLILDHPTRGLDVGAKEEVYELVRHLAKEGLALIVVSDTLEEAIGLSDTILVMKDGLIQHSFDAARGKKPQQVDLIEYMM